MKNSLKKLFNHQTIRFLFVGFLNTIVGYGLYIILLSININYLLANTISTIIAVIHSYLWNRYFTFKSKQKAITEITKFISIYITSYTVGVISLYTLKNSFHINEYIAGLLNLIITTTISYFGHKYISFKNRAE